MSLPLGRIAREWRRVLVPVGLLALVNVALHLFVIYPASIRAQSAEQRAARSRQVLADARREHAQAEAVVQSSRAADQDLERFYGDVLPASLAGARRMTYTRLAQLAREANLLYDRRSFEPDAQQKSALSALRIAMDLEGDYRDVREFIYRLESAPEFVVIEEVTLDTGTDENAPLALSMQLATFFRSSDGGE
jgi:Tfp pilus assembly protein PilO